MKSLLAVAASAAAAVGAALALLGALPPGGAAAQQAPIDAIDVMVTLDPPSALLGERVELTVAVRHSEELLISASTPRRVDGLQLVASPPPVTEPTDEGLVTTFRWAFAAFALGELQPGPLRVSWLRADGTSGGRDVTPPPLLIRSTLAAAATDLRPLKPQLGVTGAPPAWPRAAAGSALLLALLGGAAWLFVRRRRRPEAPAPRLVPATAEEQARHELNTLASERALEGGDFDRFYGTISVVVRGYLEQRFGFRATALTTGELEERMTDRGVERWQARLVAGLLDRCDAAVYARSRPDPESADHDLTVAFEIVELSRPRLAVEP